MSLSTGRANLGVLILILIIIIIQSIPTSDAYYRRQPVDQKYSRRRDSRTLKIIPSDFMLHQNLSSERAEQKLAHTSIDNSEKSGVSKVGTSLKGRGDTLHNKKVKDLEEIFLILARRDGELLNQVGNLREVTDELLHVFEFMGVADMPQKQRNEAIRKILEKGIARTKKRLKRQHRKRRYHGRQRPTE